MRALRLWCVLILPAAAFSATVDRAVLGASANRDACTVGRPLTTIESTQSEIFFRFQARRVRAGDRIRVEWVDPRGEVSSSAAYEDLPAAADLCFLTALPIGGFPPAAQPGPWWVRVVANDAVAFTRTFQITGPANPGGLMVTSVQRAEPLPGRAELRIQGAGFLSDSVVNLAQYTDRGGWSYIAALLPASASAAQLVVTTPVLSPAEYLVIVRNPDGSQSPPARFLVATPGSYKLPIAGGAPAHITQGPYGSFSHWGNSLHAYDITAPRGACIVAMRAGTAYTFDLGLRQTQNRRIFGNYISIRHEDGGFSHYAHLATGTFRVRNGQQVAQGQPLAVMGNSGYTLGEGGGYHVHVQVTRALPISSGSVPFRFDELPLTPQRSFRGVLLSANQPGPEACAAPAAAPEQTTASVAVADWWTKSLSVPQNARGLDVQLEWDRSGQALNLNLTSPSGRQYGAYGDGSGYSGSGSQPASIHLADPEPGPWRIGVHGVSGGGEAIPFRLSASVAPGAPPKRPSTARTRARGGAQ